MGWKWSAVKTQATPDDFSYSPTLILRQFQNFEQFANPKTTRVTPDVDETERDRKYAHTYLTFILT